jgi:cell wall assembly regulator SMI1
MRWVPMSPDMNAELQRLRQILSTIEMELEPQPGASDALIAQAERETGIRFDEDLKSFWRFSNGSRQSWFGVFTDERTCCSFASIEEATKAWRWFLPYVEPVPEEWRNTEPTDPRILPDRLRHRLWFPIAEFNGFSTAVYFDADPAPGGRYGQIIAYQHDPDAIYHVAESLLEFFRGSNDLIAANLTEFYFLDDPFERICHMRGLGELQRQLAAGLDPDRPNWQKKTLADMAASLGRSDLVDYLKRAK